MLQVCEDCRIVLWALDASKIKIVQAKFTESVSLAESQTVACIEAMHEELVFLNRNMSDMLASDILKHVVSSDLEEEIMDQDHAKKLYEENTTSPDATKFYVTFNKTRALKNLAEKFVKDAEDLFDQASSKATCPTAFKAVTVCKEGLGKLEDDMASPRKAIANLTCLTSLFRPLQTGETRNLLANKALKGFIAMKFKPSKGFLRVLSQHATPDMMTTFLKVYNAGK